MNLNLKHFAIELDALIGSALLMSPVEQAGAFELIRRQLQLTDLNGHHPDITNRITSLIEANRKDLDGQVDVRLAVIQILKAKHEFAETDFSKTDLNELTQLLVNDFNGLHHFGEIRKKVLEATQRVIQKMAEVTTARELINYVIREIQNIASSNRMLLYEEITLETGVAALDATLAWGTSKSKITGPVANLAQKAKVIIARKLGLLPYVLPGPGQEHLSAATKAWVEKSEPILIVNIPPINLVEIFSFPIDWDGKDFSKLSMAKLNETDEMHVKQTLAGYSKVRQNNFESIKDRLRMKIIYGLKEEPYEILDFSGKPIEIFPDAVLVKRDDRYVFLKLEFKGDFDVFRINPKLQRWEFQGKNSLVLNPAITKVANVRSMALYVMSNLGVLYISDIDLPFTSKNNISNEGKLYLESIRILTEILNQAIAPLKQKEELERFRKTAYQSYVTKFGKEVADQIFKLSQKGEVTVPPKAERAFLRFTDMRASTTYSEFLKDPAHSFLLINAFHDAFNGHTLDNNGRIISHGGDGGLHAFSSAKDAFLATVNSQQELSNRSTLLNFQLYDSYVQATIKKLEGSLTANEHTSQARDKIKLYKYHFVSELLHSIAQTYQIPVSKLSILKDFRRSIYEKIKKSKKHQDILKEAGSFFDDVVEYSKVLYEMSNGALKQKIQPLFAFDLKFSASLHGGIVAVGSIGSLSGSIDVTMIGDPVNLASRLEHLNRYYQTNLIVSYDYLADLLGGTDSVRLTGKFQYKGAHYGYRELDYVRAVGKEKPVSIYEILI